MFKRLFRNHGDVALRHLRPHLEKQIDDGTESAQRCAAEIMTGIIRGSKHWTFKMTQELWDWLTPLIRSVIDRISIETKPDWFMAFRECTRARDPNRIHQLLE